MKEVWQDSSSSYYWQKSNLWNVRLKKFKSLPNYRGWAFWKYWFEKICNRCWSKERIEVHHKDKNRKNNVKDNLEPLCFICHKTEHWDYEPKKYNIIEKWYMDKKQKSKPLLINIIERKIPLSCSIYLNK